MTSASATMAMLMLLAGEALDRREDRLMRASSTGPKRAPPRSRPRRVAKKIAARGGLKTFAGTRLRYRVSVSAGPCDANSDRDAWAT